MNRKWIILGVVATIVVGAGVVVYLKMKSSVDPTVTEPYKEKDLSVDEIKARLKNGDPKGMIEAGKQLHKLAPDQKLTALLTLSRDAKSVARFFAVKHLLKMKEAKAADRLREMAAKDSDLDVRDLAIASLDEQGQLEAYLRLAEEPHSAARILAIENLSLSDDPRAKKMLKQLAEKDPDEEVRKLAAEEL